MSSKGNTVLLIFILCGLLVLGVGAWFLWEEQNAAGSAEPLLSANEVNTAKRDAEELIENAPLYLGVRGKNLQYLGLASELSGQEGAEVELDCKECEGLIFQFPVAGGGPLFRVVVGVENPQEGVVGIVSANVYTDDDPENYYDLLDGELVKIRE